MEDIYPVGGDGKGVIELRIDKVKICILRQVHFDTEEGLTWCASQAINGLATKRRTINGAFLLL
jgi:hypothetical protein